MIVSESKPFKKINIITQKLPLFYSDVFYNNKKVYFLNVQQLKMKNYNQCLI